MKQIIWSKTMLSAYRYLERIADAIDKLVIKEAMGSISSSSYLYCLKSAETISNKIIDYTAKKVALINVKVIIEKALFEMDKNQARFLIKRYLEGKKPNEIIDEIGCPRRTYYRRLDGAIKSFAYKIKSMGFDEDKLYDMLKDQKWIMRIYSSYEDEAINYNCCENDSKILLGNIFLQNVCKLNKVSLFG